MRNISNSVLGIVLISALFTGCIQSDYTRMVKKEMESGMVYDSIFLEFEFGMTQKEFYEIGWEVNRTGKIMHGPLNRTVQYRMDAIESGKLSMYMLFFPDFDQEKKIKNMDLTFRYTTWAMGHEDFNQDVLMMAVKDTLINWYGGNDFVYLEFETDPKEVWVKVDGNRRISLTKYEEMDIKGVISDLNNPEVSNSYRK